MLYCFTVCTNRKSLEISNGLRFLQTAIQFNSEKKCHHRRPPPPIHHNYLYNAKFNLQGCLPSFQLLQWVLKKMLEVEVRTLRNVKTMKQGTGREWRTNPTTKVQ